MFNFGMGELLIILAVVLILFGPSQLPKLAKTIGRSIRDFKSAVDSDPEDDEEDEKEDRELSGEEKTLSGTEEEPSSGDQSEIPGEPDDKLAG